MDIPPHRGEHQGALPTAALHLVDVWFEVGNGGFHDLGGLEHEGKLHLPGAEEFTDHLHAGQQVLVDDLEGGLPGQGLVQVGLEPLGLPVDDAAPQPLRQGQGGQFGGPGSPHGGGGDPFEQFQEAGQRVVAVAAAVPD